ncbi:sensor histidine kinase [Paenibacillus donghaensis]|uniref:histidine kinase n=1 Tax=Paenibacillus donghaensis TaxID=414771 RepID=A0A2Z2KQC6_9BACL|nr:sensor histidine kinase [Paenibacillus donghaensis]ASA26010.1 hypothetical protein B9T62_38070 [Paenibacillus donghaensis]
MMKLLPLHKFAVFVLSILLLAVLLPNVAALESKDRSGSGLQRVGTATGFGIFYYPQASATTQDTKYSQLLPLTAATEDALQGKGGEAEGIVNIVSMNDRENFAAELGSYGREDFLGLIVGGTLIFAAIVLLGCSFFVSRELFPSGILLVLVIFSTGVLVVTYSSFLPLLISSYGRHIEIYFDLALFTLMPCLTFYFEKIFGSGSRDWVTRVRKFQIGYSLMCLLLLAVNVLLAYRLDGLYRLITVDVTGVLILLQFGMLMLLSVRQACRGNWDAIIFTVGFSVFAAVSVIELVLYYTTGGAHHFTWWKWGMMAFVLGLIMVSGRRFARNHDQVVEYSRELERFNNELQRSEKMEIISELAASVAHEVRNPLQVTRGFLQILGERSEKKEKEYLAMAVTELDRASLIITDFLTFAKPGIETVEVLDVCEELRHVSGILVPLAHLQGGTIELKMQPELQVRGSSSKFKQAFINLIKNSIEALKDQGAVTISAWKSGEHVIISVLDNGEGMKAGELSRLGEPYYSNKTKGTGLGLMVTFRIIEAMDGTIKFQSKKDEGTEVIIKLPMAHNN